MNDGDRFHPEFRVKKGFKKKGHFQLFFCPFDFERRKANPPKKEKRMFSCQRCLFCLVSRKRHLITKQKLAKEGRENKMRR
jgi:hypothetical protein